MNNEVNSTVSTPNYNEQTNNNIMNQSPVNTSSEVSTKQFVGYMLLVSFLGLIGSIIVLVIGSNKNNKTITNYAKASLIMFGIGVAVAILFCVFIFGVLGLSTIGNNSKDINTNDLNNSSFIYDYDYDDYYDYD